MVPGLVTASIKLIQELEDYCSPSNVDLSVQGLREKLEQTILLSKTSLACSHFLHELCSNPRVTVEMIELVIELCPFAAHFCTNRYHGRHVDPDDIVINHLYTRNTRNNPQHHLMSDRSYPIHMACDNPYCPPAVISLLVKQHPAATGHYCLLREGCRPDSNHSDSSSEIMEHVVGLPIHYYFAKASKLTLGAVKCLVEACPGCLGELGSSNQENYHPIHALVENQSAETMLDVLEYLTAIHPEIIKMKDSKSKLPIHLALENESVTSQVVEFLIKTWSDSIFHRDSYYHFPLHKLLAMPRDKSFTSIFMHLVEAYPEILHTPSPIDGSFPIHLAASCQSSEFVRTLVGACPTAIKRTDRKLRLSFHYACQSGQTSVVEYLFELYPECIDAADHQGLYPLHLATTRKNDPDLKVIQFLLKYDPNSVSRTAFIDPENPDYPQRYNQYLPLHYAVEKGAGMEVIRYLFDIYPEALQAVVTRVMLVNNNMSHTAAIEFFQGQLEAMELYRDLTSPLIRAIQSNATLGECSFA